MKKNRFLSLFLALVMLFGVVSALGATAMALDAPQAWWDGEYIKWKLVPGKTEYKIMGYYSVDGVVAQQKVFEDIVFVNENRVYNTQEQNYARIIHVKDGIVSMELGHWASFENIQNNSQIKYWFTLSAGTGESAGYASTYKEESELYTSKRVAGADLYKGNYNDGPYSGSVTINLSNPEVGDTLVANISGNLTNFVPSSSSSKTHYYWERYEPSIQEYVAIQGAVDVRVYKTLTADAEHWIRFSITIDGYDKVIYSESVWVNLPIKDTINISFTEPKLNARPNFNASVDNSKVELDKYTVSGFPLSYLINGTRVMNSSDTFTSGNYYQAVIIINIKTDPYSFPEDVSKINVYFNGKKATIEWRDRKTIRAYYDFTPEAADPTLSGTVTITPANPKPGDTLTANLYGGLASIPASKIHYKWQVSDEPSSGIFSTISSATGNTLSNYAFVLPGYGFRVRVTADGYEGEIISNVVTVAGGSSYQKGDVNMDKTLDNADLILVARYVVNLYNFSSEAFKLGDMDNSGAIDNSDLIRLARLLVGLS